MLRRTSLAPGLLFLIALCCHRTASNAQEKEDARSKALQRLLTFLKRKAIDLQPVDTKGTYFHYRFTIGPDHKKNHRAAFVYLPPLTLEQARDKDNAYQLPTEFYHDWAFIPEGSPRGNATPEYEADWKKISAALKAYPGPEPSKSSGAGSVATAPNHSLHQPGAAFRCFEVCCLFGRPGW